MSPYQKAEQIVETQRAGIQPGQVLVEGRGGYWRPAYSDEEVQRARAEGRKVGMAWAVAQ